MTSGASIDQTGSEEMPFSLGILGKQAKTIRKNQRGKPVLTIRTATANTLLNHHVQLELYVLKKVSLSLASRRTYTLRKKFD